MSRAKLDILDVLERLQEQHCAYSHPGRVHTYCDCKYHDIGTDLGSGEKGNGCPELRFLIRQIEAMNDKQYRKFAVRDQPL